MVVSSIDFAILLVSDVTLPPAQRTREVYLGGTTPIPVEPLTAAGGGFGVSSAPFESGGLESRGSPDEARTHRFIPLFTLKGVKSKSRLRSSSAPGEEMRFVTIILILRDLVHSTQQST